MIEIREILRLWLADTSLREVARLSGTDRKTVRRYVEMAQPRGLDRDGDVSQLTDDLLAAVIAGVRSKRPNGKSEAWETIATHHDQLKSWLEQVAQDQHLVGSAGCGGVVSHSEPVCEVSSAAAVAWQFSTGGHTVRQARERRSLRIIAISFFALATCVAFDAVSALMRGHEAGVSMPGIVIAALAVMIMPLLSYAQRRTGRELGSARWPTPKQTLICSY